MEKEQMGKAMLEMSMMENQLKQLDQQLSMLEQQIMEDEKVEANLDELRKNGKSEVILPLGGGIFTHGHMEKLDNVIVSVGANILVEKSVDDSKKMLEIRRKRMIEAREELANQVKNILQSMTHLEKGLRESGAGAGNPEQHQGHNHDHDHSGHDHHH